MHVSNMPVALLAIIIIELDWLQSLKEFFINVSYHIHEASLSLMALFKNCFKDWSQSIIEPAHEILVLNLQAFSPKTLLLVYTKHMGEDEGSDQS